MPVHDWARVNANLVHAFHQAWTVAIRNTRNGGRLPRHHSAMLESNSGGAVPGGNTEQERLADRGNRITIRHPPERVVCVIEIVSPARRAVDQPCDPSSGQPSISSARA
jgi:hypothetical protein